MQKYRLTHTDSDEYSIVAFYKHSTIIIWTFSSVPVRMELLVFLFKFDVTVDMT